MSEKHKALMKVMDQLSKLLPLLASNHVGEVANTASAIGRVLAKVSLDWHDLVQFLRKEPEPAHMRNWSPLENDQETLIRLTSMATYFLNMEDDVFADIAINGHRETLPLASQEYLDWLMRAFWTDKERIPTDAQLKHAVRLVRAQARFSDNTARHDVHLRVAESNDKIYVDLGDDSWSAVEISGQGWRIVQNPPVKFRRSKGMKPLPLPVRGGSIEELRQFTNLNEADCLLLVAVVLDTLRVGRPHPVLFITGGQGTAKSTLTKILGSLIDPNWVKLRHLPNAQDLSVAANNQSVLCFDNVSYISAEISDKLCKLSSGAGFAKRKNYTDGDEFRVGGSHAVFINGIHNCINKPDLADRAVVINLRPISPVRRRTEAEILAAFNAAHPRILGALLDIAAHGLANLNEVKTSELARVADFQRWAMACEGAFADAGAFQRAFTKNVSDAVEGLLDGDPVGKAIAAFMCARNSWQGTAAQLLADLTRHDPTEARVTRQPTWPRDPARFSKALRDIQATLAKAGITVEFGKAPDRTRTRIVKIRNSSVKKRQRARQGSPPKHSISH